MKKIIILILLAMTVITTKAQTSGIVLTIGSRQFTATLEQNATATAFRALLPVTWQMSELNGNEKYHYISGSLPTASTRPGTINAGDIMLYGSNCIVVFYKTFSSGYTYTRIGHIDDTTGLEQALGSGSVAITFAPSETTGIKSITKGSNESNEYYSLNGTKTTHPGKGLYIKDGRKTIVK